MMDYRLYLVTDAFDYQEETFLQVVEEAIKAGVGYPSAIPR